MINTGGFQVQQMPQYTAPNPALIAANPGSFTQGALQGIGVQQNIADLQAFRQHAAELAATEKVRTQLLQAQADQASILRDQQLEAHKSEVEKQIALNKLAASTAPGKAAAQNATSAATAATAGPGALASIAGSEAATKVIPAQTALTLGDIATKEKLHPLQEATAITEAQGEAGRAAQAEQVKSKQLQLADQALNYQGEIDPQKHQLLLRDINQQLAGQSDPEVARKLLQAKVNTEEKLGSYYDAHGAFMMGTGRQTGAKLDPAKAIDNYSEAIRKLESTVVGGDKQNPITLAQYEAATYGPHGQRNTSQSFLSSVTGGKFGTSTQVPLNTTGEILLKQRNVLQGALQSAVQRMSVGETAPAEASQQSPEDAEALNWAQQNPSDPRSAAILQRLGIK